MKWSDIFLNDLSRNQHDIWIWKGFGAFVKILSERRRKDGKKFRSLEVRRKLIALKKACLTILNCKCYLYVLFIPFFVFVLFLVTFGNKVMKIQKYYVIFVYILQGKMGKTEKNRKKITQLKWPKYQKPQDGNVGWKKHKTAVILH